MIQVLNPDDVEEMDIQRNMVKVAYGTQRQERTNRNFNKPSLGKNIRFDKSKVRCYKCIMFGHFSRELNNLSAKSTQNTTNQSQNKSGQNSNQASTLNTRTKFFCVTYDGEVDWNSYGA